MYANFYTEWQTNSNIWPDVYLFLVVCFLRTVRQALLVATSMVFLVVPSTYLLIDLQVDVMETKVWLEGMYLG